MIHVVRFCDRARSKRECVTRCVTQCTFYTFEYYFLSWSIMPSHRTLCRVNFIPLTLSLFRLIRSIAFQLKHDPSQIEHIAQAKSGRIFEENAIPWKNGFDRQMSIGQNGERFESQICRSLCWPTAIHYSPKRYHT